MGCFLRYGNWAVAKMTELLFNTTLLTDMGCTYRLLSREAIDLIRPHLTIGGSHFGPQILLEVIEHGISFVEIPLNYHPRVGRSSVTGSLWKAFRLGWQMIFLVFGYRFGFYQCERTNWQPRCWSTDAGTLPQQLAEGTEQSSLALMRAVAQGSPLHNVQTEGTTPAGQAWPRTDSTGIDCRSRDDTVLRVPLR
jgi:hypothetical protein